MKKVSAAETIKGILAQLAQVTSVVTTALQEENSQQTAEEDEDCENNEDDKELTDAAIEGNLSSSVLNIELTKNFKQLFKVRKEVIFLSHLENHGMEDFDISAADFDMEAIPVKTVDSLNLSKRVLPVMVDHLGLILKGIRTKRVVRKEGQKECASDDEYRDKYLNFLKVCWVLSGAEKRENVLEENEEQLIIISSMEKAVAKIISRFLFLDYMCCTSSPAEG